MFCGYWNWFVSSKIGYDLSEEDCSTNGGRFSHSLVVFVLTEVECLRIFHLTALLTLASLCYTFLALIYSLCSIICLYRGQDAGYIFRFQNASL